MGNKLLLSIFLISNAFANKDINTFDTIPKLGKALENFYIEYKVSINDLKSENISLKEQLREQVNIIHALQRQVDVSMIEKEAEQVKSTVSEEENAVITKVAKRDGVNSYSKPYREDIYLAVHYDYSEIVTISYCNKYDWCKVQDKEEFLPKYALIQKDFIVYSE